MQTPGLVYTILMNDFKFPRPIWSKADHTGRHCGLPDRGGEWVLFLHTTLPSVLPVRASSYGWLHLSGVYSLFQWFSLQSLRASVHILHLVSLLWVSKASDSRQLQQGDSSSPRPRSWAPRTRWEQGWFPPRLLSWACGQPSSPHVLTS